MSLAFDPGGVERFRDLVARSFGLSFDDAKLGFLGEVLRRRADAAGVPAGLYLSQLESGVLGKESGALAEELTVGETYFFRNGDQFRAFTETVLPERMRARAATRQLRFLSAGCSSGEEAYSLAIAVRQAIADPHWKVSILAVDINPAALRKAASGRFSAWALRDTPPETLERWFKPSGRDMILSEDVQAAVRFEQRNLTVDDAELWMPEAYDAVFCRNVVMYFTPAIAQKVIGRIARSLAPGGYLFLGHAETLRGVSQDFHLAHTHGTFYYQRKSGPDDAAPLHLPDTRRKPAPAFPPSIVPDATWFETIGKATQRIQALAEARPAAVPSPVAPVPAWSLGSALDLLQRERYGEALDLVHRLPAEAEGTADVLLLRAVLLAHNGQIAAAGEACRQLLAADELNAGANYVLALCFESLGDRTAAAEKYRVAAYLDPAFAMPRLHLGLLARRGGDISAARRELGQALDLLRREEASRLLLFGGGFTREALVALCEAELRSCEARP